MRTIVVHIVIAAFALPSSLEAQRTLTLEDSRQLVLANNAGIRKSELEQEAAQQSRAAAITAYFPTITAGGFLFRAQDNLLEISSRGGNLPVYDGNPYRIPFATQYAYLPPSTTGMLRSGTIGMVSAVQPVFAGGRIINGNKLAGLGEDVSGYQGRLARNNVLLRTEKDYWQVVSLRDKLATVKRYEDMLNSLMRRVEDAYRSGLVTKGDVLKVRLRRNDVLIDKSRLMNAVTIATMALCQHIGIPFDSTLTLSDTLQVSEIPQSFFVDHAEALKTTAEYRLLQAAVRGEELQSDIKLGGYLPQLSVGVSGFYTRFDENKDRTVGMVFGTLSIPISGWWEASHTLGEEGCKRQIAENALKEGSELLMLQMEKAWHDLTEAHERVLFSGEAVTQAEENLAENQDSYSNGILPVSDLLEAEAQLQHTHDQLTDARAEFRTRLLTYLQATGR